MKNRLVALALACALPILPAIAPASAAEFPDRPIRLIVPFPPGGSADPIGRILAQGMEKTLKQTIVVENRSGAGGVIGTDAVAKAAPDGYTIGLPGVGSMTVVQHFMPSLPYVASRDLAPISLVVGVPQLLVVNPAVKAKTVQDLLALARAKPGQITYGSSGNGNSPHLAAASLALRTGVEMTHVPYRGVAPAVTDLMAGRVNMMFADLPALIGPARDGTIVPLAVGSPERSPALPNVPTLDEAGVKGVDVENWYGLVAPAGTPADRIALLNRAVVAALADSDIRQRLIDLGTRVIGSSPEAFAEHLKRETEKWAALVKAADIKAE
ncbi:tripartite tricarboxylate transporter substrate binding protein [Acetobacteraceae bacterium H6797]|nr:tripartite tricarboxylate transporter substrate binding protein [Acetobacteraceae bacterium H6797]